MCKMIPLILISKQSPHQKRAYQTFADFLWVILQSIEQFLQPPGHSAVCRYPIEFGLQHPAADGYSVQPFQGGFLAKVVLDLCPNISISDDFFSGRS
ncbi:hypothetical protein [Thiolapillus sp.]